MKKLKYCLQFLLDKYDYWRYCDRLVIGNRPYEWCYIPVPQGYPKQSQTHPAIVFSSKPWNGYTYWLATTPYPDEQIEYENPCIYRSNDAVHFLPINRNPILEHPGGTAYNSDPELFFFGDQLFCIVRENENGRYLREIKLLSSRNGNDWSLPKTIYTSNDPDRQLLSPSYLYKAGKHRIYFLNGDAGIGRHGQCTGIEVIESDEVENGKFERVASGRFVNKDEVKIEPWHFDLFEYNGDLYMILCGRDRGQQTIRNSMYTYLAKSDNGQDFYIYPKPIIRFLKSYRPSAFVDKSGVLHLYFSIIGGFLKDGSDRNIGKVGVLFEELLTRV